MAMNAERHIDFNVRAYNRTFDSYEKVHTEIFNPVEQARLHTKLAQAAGYIKTRSATRRALDYGCGTGNLTNHLIGLGFHVTSADTSAKCLALTKKKYSGTGILETVEINGRDLIGIEDNSFDLTAIYSVLHHIPDYLQAVKEAIRVTNRGGAIYIDHEHSPSYWNRNKEYKEFLRLVTPKKTLKRFLKLSNYIININKIINPRYHPEGDMHLWLDDHIEWGKIEHVLNAEGCEIVINEDYLLYDSRYPIDVYEKYKDKCNDIRLICAVKR
jgi:ubiquinone/menaquinone biosynthesis C-methylase UbiE